MKKNIDALQEIFNSYITNAENDSGAWGKAFERALKVWFGMQDKVAKPGQVDFRRARKNMEVKTGAGELDMVIRSKQKYVVCVPVVVPERGLLGQEGFIVDRLRFLEILDEVALLRTKPSRSASSLGEMKVTIQTFYNHKQGKPHGTKYFDLLDALYNDCIMTLEDFFEADGILEVEG